MVTKGTGQIKRINIHHPQFHQLSYKNQSKFTVLTWRHLVQSHSMQPKKNLVFRANTTYCIISTLNEPAFLTCISFVICDQSGLQWHLINISI